MKKVSVEEVMFWNPCSDYPEERIKELWNGKDLSALDILDLNVSGEDRLWAVLRTEFFTENELHELACDYAERVIGIYEKYYPQDFRPRNAIFAKRKFIKGEISKEELAAARDAAGAAAGAAAWAAAGAAARAAAWAAAWAAARAAAGAAARAAAWAAAWAAARAAAGAAARDAAGAAAGAAEIEKQIEITRQKLLTKHAEELSKTA